jgi:hypothetical protein
MSPHSVHVHVRRLTLEGARDHAAVVEAIRRAVAAELAAPAARSEQGRRDWTQTVAAAVSSAVRRGSTPEPPGAMR